MNYEWVLFDADDTLFHFDAYSGLQIMLSKFNLDFTVANFTAYQLINKGLWNDYQKGITTLAELKHKRFESLAHQLSISTEQLNAEFILTMAEVCTPIDGAVELLNSLYGKVKIGIITNGFMDLQHTRLAKNNFTHFFDLLVVSEQVGFAKPHEKIFNYALNAMSNPEPHRVLMVGDNPDSDIVGGINVGFDTCWLNLHNLAVPAEVAPTYQVSSLRELAQLLNH